MFSFNNGESILVEGDKGAVGFGLIVDHYLELATSYEKRTYYRDLEPQGIARRDRHKLFLTAGAAKILEGIMYGGHRLKIVSCSTSLFERIEYYISRRGSTVIRYDDENESFSSNFTSLEEIPGTVLGQMRLQPVLLSGTQVSVGSLLGAVLSKNSAGVDAIIQQISSLQSDEVLSEEISYNQWRVNVVTDSTRLIDAEFGPRYNKWQEHQGIITLSTPSRLFVGSFVPTENDPSGMVLMPTLAVGVWRTLSAWSQPYAQYT